MPRSITCCLVAIASLVAACGGSEGSKGSPSAPSEASVLPASVPATTAGAPEGSAAVTTTTADTSALDEANAEIDAFLAEVASLDQSAQEGRMFELATRAESTFLAQTGIVDALGGEDTAAAAFVDYSDELSAQLTGAVAWLDDNPGLGRSARGGRSHFAETAGLSTVVATVMMTTGIIVAGALSATAGDHVSGSGQGMTIEGDRGSMSTEMEFKKETGAVTGSIRVKVTMNPCPNPDGEVEATIVVMADASGGGRGGNLKMEAEVLGRVDDDANLAGTDVDATVEGGDYSTSSSGSTSSPNTWMQATIGYGVGAASTLEANTGVNITSKTPSLSDKEAAGTAAAMNLMLTMVVFNAMNAAETAWQSGRCVKLEPTTDPATRTGLEPDETVTIQAAPRSLIDGGQVGGSVTATMKSGEASVAPSGSKVEPDATFTYTAPPEREKDGEVQLEARSKRGAVKTTLDFDTKGRTYSFKGNIADVTGNGLKCGGETGDWVADLAGSPGGFATDMHVVASIGEDLSGTVAVTWTWTGNNGSGGGDASGVAFVEVDADGVATALKVGPLYYTGSGELAGFGVGGSGSTEPYTFPVVNEHVICS